MGGGQIIREKTLRNSCVASMVSCKLLSGLSFYSICLCLSGYVESPVVPEWHWLHNFSTAIASATALHRRGPFPASFRLPRHMTCLDENQKQPQVSGQYWMSFLVTCHTLTGSGCGNTNGSLCVDIALHYSRGAVVQWLARPCGMPAIWVLFLV